jgi:MFS-type transporter involved in bile tolerance (Atg22 family)
LIKRIKEFRVPISTQKFRNSFFQKRSYYENKKRFIFFASLAIHKLAYELLMVIMRNVTQLKGNKRAAVLVTAEIWIFFSAAIFVPQKAILIWLLMRIPNWGLPF